MNDEHLNGRESQVARRLKRLIEANHSLADIESLETLFPRLLDLAKDVTSAEASSLMVYNPERKVLEFASIEDEVGGEKTAEVLKSSVKLKLGEGIAGWVAANRKSVIVRDAQNDPRLFRKADQQTGFVTRSLLAVPLVHHNELLGVISVLNSKDKPFFDNEDQELLESFADIAAVAMIRSRLIETRLKQQRFQTQLEAASKIQSLFWPTLPKLGGDSNVWAVSLPAALVGGDLYDVIAMSDGSWLIYVADVSDKGLPAALIMAALSIKIRSEVSLHSEVNRLLETVNDAMYDLMADEGFFATIVLGKYWPGTGKLQFTLAGHLPPLWVAGNELKKVPEVKGMPLGVTPKTIYEEREVILSPGEAILFITDGLTEAENQGKELFGYRRIVDCMQKSKGPPWGECILNAVNSWRGYAETSDDLTMLEIWRDLP